MEVGRSGENGQSVLQAVGLVLNQELEHVLHQSHLEVEHLAKERIQAVNLAN